MDRSRLLLGFDFYGAGNIGDDLMLKGFLDVFSQNCDARLSCALPKDLIPSQKKRFSQVEWLSVDSEEREDLILACDCWIGVGGTPFQASIGRWLLNRINQDFDCSQDKKKWMIGVGCEEEVLREKMIARKVALDVDHIWARDEKSRELLVDSLGVNNNNVTTGGDLAHIALKEIFTKHNSTLGDGSVLGIIYNAECPDRDSLRAIKKFVLRVSKEKQVVFAANDIRRKKGFEFAIYKDMFGGLGGLFGFKPKIFSPDYGCSDVADLVRHFSSCETVMASRYHAILTAAWAGCRVVALDRSSKIRNLADELNIPIVRSPFTVDALYDGYSKAVTVSRDLLEEKAMMAEKSIVALCDLIH